MLMLSGLLTIQVPVEKKSWYAVCVCLFKGPQNGR